MTELTILVLQQESYSAQGAAGPADDGALMQFLTQTLTLITGDNAGVSLQAARILAWAKSQITGDGRRFENRLHWD